MLLKILKMFVYEIVILHIMSQVPTVPKVFQEVKDLNATTTNSLRILIFGRSGHVYIRQIRHDYQTYIYNNSDNNSNNNAIKISFDNK